MLKFVAFNNSDKKRKLYKAIHDGYETTSIRKSETERKLATER